MGCQRAMQSSIFGPYKRLYQSTPGACPAVPASRGGACVSLLAIPTDTVGNLPRNRRGIAAVIRGFPYVPYGLQRGKGVNANIMAWYCMGVDIGVK